jgi:hypothetical protein
MILFPFIFTIYLYILFDEQIMFTLKIIVEWEEKTKKKRENRGKGKDKEGKEKIEEIKGEKEGDQVNGVVLEAGEREEGIFVCILIKLICSPIFS